MRSSTRSRPDSPSRASVCAVEVIGDGEPSRIRGHRMIHPANYVRNGRGVLIVGAAVDDEARPGAPRELPDIFPRGTPG
jgi:hypothetical protein